MVKETNLTPEAEINPEAIASLLVVLDSVGATNLKISPTGQTLNSLEPDQARETLKDQLQLYGDVWGFSPRFWVKPKSPVVAPKSSEVGAMVHPRLKLKNKEALLELVFAGFDPQKNDWRLITIESGQGSQTNICEKSSAELVKYCSENCQVLEEGYYWPILPFLPPGLEEHSLIAGHKNRNHFPQVKHLMELAIQAGRNLWLDSKAVVILSNIKPQINGIRTEVACDYWQILNRVAKITGQTPPLLIPNGYQWQNEQMEEIAQVRGIPAELIRPVLLEEGEATIDHAPRMIEQLNGFSKTFTYITSDEHLLRAAVLLGRSCIASGKTDITFYPFGVPASRQDLRNLDLWAHEFEMLLNYETENFPESLLRLKFPAKLAPSVWAQFAIWRSLRENSTS